MNQLAIVGLGKMGGNMARRLAKAGFQLVLFDQNQSLRESLAAELKAIAVTSLKELVVKLESPRTIWLMLPAGEITETALTELKHHVSAKDRIIDGANSFYKDSQRRAEALQERGIAFIDVGVSGGIWGEKNGYALMIGGEQNEVSALNNLWKALAPSATDGWLHCGPCGSGHFVKMIHNGIEYGMMQAFAEGLSLLKAKHEFSLNLAEISEMWRHGSVVRSWLLDLIANFLKQPNEVEGTSPIVADSGEGRWTALESIEQGIPAPVILAALNSRFSSQGKDDFASKLLAQMRKGFGGHAVQSSSPKSFTPFPLEPVVKVE